MLWWGLFFLLEKLKNNPQWAKLLAEKLKKLGLKNDAKIIDLGAGTGIASEILATKGYQNFTLFDQSAKMLAVARKKPKLEKAKFIVADITRLNLKEKFDAVVSVMLFNEFKDKKLEKVLLKVKNIMKAGALIALVTDSREDTYSRLFKKIEDGSTKDKSAITARYYFIGKKT